MIFLCLMFTMFSLKLSTIAIEVGTPDKMLIELLAADRIAQYIYDQDGQGGRGAIISVTMKTPQLMVSLCNSVRDVVVNRGFII